MKALKIFPNAENLTKWTRVKRRQVRFVLFIIPMFLCHEFAYGHLPDNVIAVTILLMYNVSFESQRFWTNVYCQLQLVFVGI